MYKHCEHKGGYLEAISDIFHMFTHMQQWLTDA